jgi:hypothetical protein
MKLMHITFVLGHAVYVATHVPFPHIFLVSLCLEGNADTVPELQAHVALSPLTFVTINPVFRMLLNLHFQIMQLAF